MADSPPKALETTTSGCTVANNSRLDLQRCGAASARHEERRPGAVTGGKHCVPGEQIPLAIDAGDEIAGATVRMAGRGNRVDAVRVDAPSSLHGHIDVRAAADRFQLHRGRMQPGAESIGDPGQHRARFVEMRQILRAHAAEGFDGIEVCVGSRTVEQDVAARPSPQIRVRGQPWKR